MDLVLLISGSEVDGKDGEETLNRRELIGLPGNEYNVYKYKCDEIYVFARISCFD